MEGDAELWGFLERHLASIYQGDWATYEATTHPDLSLYEWFVIPHRLDGLAFHRFMIEHNWATRGRPCGLDLLEKSSSFTGMWPSSATPLTSRDFLPGPPCGPEARMG